MNKPTTPSVPVRPAGPAFRTAPLQPVRIAWATPGSPQSLAQVTGHALASAARSRGVDVRRLADVPETVLNDDLPCTVVFVESATSALARALDADPAVDPLVVLRQWKDGVRRVLSEAHGLPRTLAVFDVDECHANPERFWQALAACVGIEAGAAGSMPGLSTPKAASQLHRLTAAAFVRRERELQPLQDGLAACCTVLSEGWQSSDDGDPAAGLAEVRSIKTHAAEVLRMWSRDAALLHDREEEIGRLHADLKRCETDLGEAQARAGRQREALELALEEQEALFHEAKGARAAKEDAEAYLHKLHEAHELLAICHLRCRELERYGGGTGDRLAGPLEVAGVRTVQDRRTGSHRHLHLRLESARFGTDRWDAIDVRLVEHSGRPGLVIFQPSAGPKPVSAWNEGGSEEGRAFMIVVPSDPAGRDLCLRLGTRDWQFLLDLCSLLRREASENSPWRPVCRRLMRQMADLPPRVRYDGIETTAVDGQPGSIDIRFLAVAFGNFGARTLRLGWRGAQGRASSCRLSIHAPEAGSQDGPALVAWPFDEAGVASDEWVVPLGAVGTRLDKVRQWAALPAGDRDLVRGLLDALPAAVDVAQREAQLGESSATRARAIASDVRREARRCSALATWWPRIRRIARLRR